MKKLGALLLAAVMLFGFGACSARDAASYDPDQADHGPKIVCTTYPICDWAKRILGDAAEECQLVLLGGSGVDLHSYQPSVADIAAIASCDLFFYVGGESDEWVEDALAIDHKDTRAAFSLMEILEEQLKEEEHKEGMQEEAHGHGAEHEEHEEDPEYDEHVWLSLKNAEICVEKMTEAISALMPDKAAGFAQNAASYEASLAELDSRFTAAVKAALQKTLLFGDRFPFRYLVDDYGLDYYAAFAGCSSETAASFETVIFLAGKLDELQLPAVCILEDSDGTLAETIRQASSSKDQTIVTFDSLQSVTAADIAAGKTYLSAMENNLKALQDALR